MSFYWIVTWIAFSCPGGLLAPVWPAAAKPFVCERVVHNERYSRRSDAERQVRAVGSSARLAWCRNLKCWDKPIRWDAVAVIE